MDGRMREILFKAKRKNWRELPEDEWWIEGYTVKYQPCASKNEYVYGIVPTYASALYIIEIVPETLCQYIGKNDKKGKKIWENDIISISTYSYTEPEDDYFGKVVYAEGWACWCIQQPEEERPIPLCECEGSYQTDIFAEGNIFDNPELLGQDGG